jgi:putative membrane protein
MATVAEKRPNFSFVVYFPSVNPMKMRRYQQRTAAFLGAVALTALIGLPAVAQVNRPNVPGAGQTPQNVPGQQQPGNINQPGRLPGQQPGVNQPGTQQSPQVRPGQQQPTAAISSLDREFMVMAAQGNNAEIQTSRLALQRSQDQQVRRFAQQMIDEHSQANDRLTAIARQYGVTLPTDPGPLNAAIAQELATLSGADFDRAYMEAQENAHLRTIGLYRTVIQQGRAPDVQSYASALLPNVDGHYRMANQMVNQARAGNMRR